MTDTDDTPSEITLRVMRDRDTHDGSIYGEAQKMRARIEQLEAALYKIAQGGNKVRMDWPASPALDRESMCDIARDALNSSYRQRRNRMERPDPPELKAACDVLRQIYWREYGRGWREAIQSIKAILEKPTPIEQAKAQIEVGDFEEVDPMKAD